jgi:hypothetical protein
MMKWTWPMAAFVLMAAAAPARTEDQVLAWKWRAGLDVTYRTTVETSQEFLRSTFVMRAGHKQTTDVRYRVLDVTPEGVARLETTYRRIRVETDMAGGALVWDSDQPEEAALAGHPLVQPLRALVGQSFVLIIEPSGRIREVQGFEQVYRRLTGTTDLDDASLQRLLHIDSLRREMETYFRILPEHPVDVGDTWDYEYEQATPWIGASRIRNAFTLTAVEPDAGSPRARIRFSTRPVDPARRTEPAGPRQAELDRLAQDTLSRGELVFDIDRGLLLTLSVDASTSLPPADPDEAADGRPHLQRITHYITVALLDPPTPLVSP